jgi:mRNA interferase RelE/StbE
MREYRIWFKPSAERALRRLPTDVQRRIVVEAARLARDPSPHGVVKLAGDDNLWRIRSRDYRVVYEIHDARLLIVVLRVAHRKDVYRP